MKKYLAVLLSAPLCIAVHTTALADEEQSWADRISVKGDLRLRYEGVAGIAPALQ